MPPQGSTCTKSVKKFVQRTMGCSVQKKEKWKIDMDARPPHLLHLIREQLIEPSPEDKNKKKSVKCSLNLVREQLIGSSPKDKNEKKSVKRLLHQLRKRLIGSSTEDKNKEKSVKWRSYHSVMELESAGIHFRPSQTNHVTDVKLKSHLISGTLTLPPIVVDDSTKSYICLMDSFIDHADDVKELRKRGIILNNLGSDDELAQLFNEIANDLVFDPSVYAGVKTQIQNHCDSKAKVWMAEWMHDHFSSPWAFLAFLGAIFVIALTVVQTYFAVFPH